MRGSVQGLKQAFDTTLVAGWNRRDQTIVDSSTTGLALMSYPLQLHCPSGYTPGELLSLVVTNHGSDEEANPGDAGYGTLMLTQGGPAMYATTIQGIGRCIVLAFQRRASLGDLAHWPLNHQEMRHAIQVACTLCNIDRKRIYLASFSKGSERSWDFLCRYPTLFAGALICSGAIQSVVLGDASLSTAVNDGNKATTSLQYAFDVLSGPMAGRITLIHGTADGTLGLSQTGAGGASTFGIAGTSNVGDDDTAAKFSMTQRTSVSGWTFGDYLRYTGLDHGGALTQVFSTDAATTIAALFTKTL